MNTRQCIQAQIQKGQQIVRRKIHSNFVKSNDKYKSIARSKLETMFMKHCVPNHSLVHKECSVFLKKGHLKFEALSYTTRHPVSADQV